MTNYTHFSIDRYHRSQWWKRNRKWFVILIISLAILFTLWWIGTANAEMNSNYQGRVHHCISTYRELNQNNATFNLNPQDCLKIQ